MEMYYTFFCIMIFLESGEFGDGLSCYHAKIALYVITTNWEKYVTIVSEFWKPVHRCQ